MINTLSGKKILMFSPKFFNYEQLICTEITKQGGVVHYYDERNNPTSLQKIILRKAHFLMDGKINKYYMNVCMIEKDFNPDYVLFISPESVNKKSIQKMRLEFPNANFILYMWDSIENKNAKKVYELFDKCFSFDQLDCEKYGFKFRPLFFSSEFEKKIEKKEYKYQFGFIGSIHSDRAKILNQLKEYFEENGLSYYFYIFVPGKLMYFVRSFMNKDFRNLKRFIHFDSLDKTTVANILTDTNYVIDINHPKQVGLTMRTIEMLGLKRKLLTTNEYIKNYDFYNEANQLIFTRNQRNFTLDCISNDFIEIDENVINRYRLSNWITDIFE